MAVPVGLVGTGNRASDLYAPALSACGEVEFVAVWGRSPEPARQLAERFGATPCTGFDELLERCAGIVFAVPPAVQEEYAGRAARRGRAILLEKPLGADTAGAEELTSVVVRERVPTMVALLWRFGEDVRRFLDTDVPAVEPVGGVGRLLTATHADGARTPAWRVARGVLADGGADMFDVLEAALGQIVGIHAHGDPRGWVGVTLDHRVGRWSEVTLYAGRTRGPGVAFVEVTGPRGTTEVEALGALGPAASERMVGEFARVVSDGRSHPFDIQHGLHLQRLVESAQTDLVLHG